MTLNDHISDRADWRCLERTPKGEQCARWMNHTPYHAEDRSYDHMPYQDVMAAFVFVIGMYEKYDIEEIDRMIVETHQLVKLWYFRAILIYNSKVYVQGVDDV
jgi:hypothetical protein